MNTYLVTYTGQGSGYNLGDYINVKSTTIKETAWEVNRNANLNVCDIGYLSGDINEMIFGTLMDGIVFDTPVLKIELIK